jgi:hypothetical protein
MNLKLKLNYKKQEWWLLMPLNYFDITISMAYLKGLYSQSSSRLPISWYKYWKNSSFNFKNLYGIIDEWAKRESAVL